jgi:hypothetical protein
MSDMKMIDLVMLVPGKNERETFDGLLSSRQMSLEIRKVKYEILVHPRRDPGCFHEGPDILQPFQGLAQYSLVVLDYEGSGQEGRPSENVRNDLKRRLETSGWADRTEVLVLYPELENWVWSDSPEVDQAVGWQGRKPSLREWLVGQEWWPKDTAKPSRPKECLEVALREVRMRRSSAIYRQLAEKVGLTRCQDEGFRAFRETMKSWFPSI